MPWRAIYDDWIKSYCYKCDKYYRSFVFVRPCPVCFPPKKSANAPQSPR